MAGLKYSGEITTELQIMFDSKTQLNSFVNWFNKEGFELFLRSRKNSSKDPVTCMALL